MQINKKPSALADTMFDLSKTFSKSTTSATLHGRFMMLKEIQIFLAEKETELNEQINKNDNIK